MAARARRTGWVTLVAILFLIAGGFDVIWGLVAVGVSLGGTDATVLGDLSRENLTGLGIVGIVVGGLQIFAGAGILARSRAAMVVGLALAIVAVLLHFAYHRVLEGWAFSGLFVNLVIILILTLRREEFS